MPATTTETPPITPELTRDQAWERIRALGERARTDRDGALAQLQRLFASGWPSTAIDGETEGRLVTFTVHPAFDRVAAAITGAWMPWAGKRFDAGARIGDNLLARSARLPARLPWPTYGMREAGENLAAFDFETRVEPGALDPDVDVLVIDYASVERNPRLIIKQVRDELVEIAPGVHLGKMLWRRGSGPDARHSLAAYFALRSS